MTLKTPQEINTDFAFKASDFGLTGPQIVELYEILNQAIAQRYLGEDKTNK